MALMIIELLIVLGALYVGSRYGSLALGAISGIGLAILVFGFGMKPGTPPTDVIYIIIAAVTCAGTLQASGGMDWMIQVAEKMLRKHPDHITFLAPLNHLRHRPEERNTPGKALRRCLSGISGGHHLLPYRRSSGGIHDDFQQQRLHGHDSSNPVGDHSCLHNRNILRLAMFLPSRQGPGQRSRIPEAGR